MRGFRMVLRDTLVVFAVQVLCLAVLANWGIVTGRADIGVLLLLSGFAALVKATCFDWPNEGE